MSTDECVFCSIILGQIPVDKVWESGRVLAFHDANPSAESHILIVPKVHVADFQSLDDLALWDDMRQTAQQLIEQLNLKNGYKLVLNGGKYQHIAHLHWHLLGGELKTSQ